MIKIPKKLCVTFERRSRDVTRLGFMSPYEKNMIKIPKKLYVTFQRRSRDVTRLGFMSPYEKNAAFEKRRITQDNWAYNNYVNGKRNQLRFEVRGQDQITLTEGDGTEAFMLNCYPAIIDNESLSGFEINKRVRRGGGWSGSNVVWRVTDPRDFELEISSENLQRIIDCATIVNGVIQGKCCWGRDGAKNVLLPENSDVYREAVVTTKKLITTVPLKELTPGDKVVMLSKDYPGECHYLGKFYCIVYTQKQRNNLNVHNMETILKPLFRDTTGVVFTTSTKVSSIVKKQDLKIDMEQLLSEIRAQISSNDVHETMNEKILVVFVSDKPVSAKDVKISIEDTKIKLNVINYQYKTFMLINQDDEFYQIDSHLKAYPASNQMPQKNHIHTDRLLNGDFTKIYKTQYQRNNSYFGSGYERRVQSDLTNSDCNVYQLMFEIDGAKQPIVQIKYWIN